MPQAPIIPSSPSRDPEVQQTPAQLPTPGQPPLTSQQAKDFVINRYSQAQQASIPYYTRAATWYKLFRNQSVVRNYVGLANLFVPEPYRVVAKKTAKLSKAIKQIRANPETANDQEASKVATPLLNFLRRKLNWNVLERLAIQESRIVGMAWLKILWNVEKETPDKPYMGFDMSFDTVDHVILPPDMTMQKLLTEGTPWLVHAYEQELAELNKNPNYDKAGLAQLEQRSGSRKSTSNILEQARVMFTQAQRGYTIKQRKKFQVLEYWGYLPVNKVREDGTQVTEQWDALVVVVDKDVVLRVTDNPYAKIIDGRIPLTPIVARIVGQETYPVGDIEPAESLFNELNDTRNQRMDTVTLNIDPMKIILRGANIDDKDLIARRGWVVKSSVPPSQAVQVVPPNMTGVKAAIDEEQIIRGDIQQVTGTLDFGQNSEAQAGLSIDTARGTIIAKDDADLLTEEELDLLKICLRKVYRIVLSYSQVFLDKQFTMRLVEKGVESFMDASKDSIAGNLDLDVEMETLQDKTSRQQVSILLLNQARETPGANVGQFFTDALEALKDDQVQIDEYYQAPQPQPEQPKVSISLKGDLTQLQSSEVFKTVPGVDPHMGDPLMTKEGRMLAKGIHPEDLEMEKHTAELAANKEPGSPVM